MQRNVVFTSLCAIFFVCALAILFLIKQVEAHPNLWHITEVTENCYLLGYPSRTYCSTRTYYETDVEFSLDDHILIIVHGRHFYFHYPGHQNHDTDWILDPPLRKLRVKTVLNSCSECSTF